MNDVGHANETLAAARHVLTLKTGNGPWPRAAAFLGRQALEDAMAWVWLTRAPGVEDCSMRAQLLCLRELLGDQDLAEEAAYIYGRLSWACHHHPYELSPTPLELDGWLDQVEIIIAQAADSAKTGTS